MFEDLKVSEWWFLGIAALVGYFVVKHFMDKLPGNLSEPQPGAHSSPGSRQHENTSRSEDFNGSGQQQGPNDQASWFRREEEEAAGRASQKTAQAASDPTPRHWYQVLEVSSVASIEDIRQAYKRKIRLYHPDKVAGLGPEFMAIAEAKAKEINEAYRKACTARGAS